MTTIKHSLLTLFISTINWTHSFCQQLSKEDFTLLEQHTDLIHYDSVDKTTDWSFLLPHLKDKQLILLGEFNHGSKEVFEIRNSMIKYLHQHMGIKAILFEAGIGEMASVDINKEELTAREMLNALFGVWRTKEFADLMDYIKTNDISVSGFDVQRSGSSFNMLLTSVVQKNDLDSGLVNSLEERFGLVSRDLKNRKAVYDTVKEKTALLIGDYENLNNILKKLALTDSSRDLLLAQITIENRVRYLSYMLQFAKDKDWNRQSSARDSAMASNTQWLIDHFYKDEPVIIIGHNYHISKYNKKEVVMGEVLASTYNNKIYTVGIFAKSGTYLDNTGKVVNMLPPDSVTLDIKHITLQKKGQSFFIDISEKKLKGSEWLNTEITVNDSFIDMKGSNKMILSETFDGLIILDKVSPPAKDF